MARLGVLLASLCYVAAVSSVYVQQDYHQPGGFAAPFPVVAKSLYAKAEPIIVEEIQEVAEDDDSEEYEEDGGGDDYDGDNSHENYEDEEDDSHEHGDGNAYGAAHHSEHGAAGNKGYKSQHGFYKGESGDHGADYNKGVYQKGAGHGDKYYDEADAYGENYEGSKGYKGEDFGHKNIHSKGEGTTGFHKVYRNNDFKKDHVFYDKADNSGHYNKHASGDSRHHSAAGGHEKGDEYDAAYIKGGYGKAGYSEHGGHHDADKGYAGKGGDESYYSHHGDNAEQGGHANGKEFGYGHSHGH